MLGVSLNSDSFFFPFDFFNLILETNRLTDTLSLKDQDQLPGTVPVRHRELEITLVIRVIVFSSSLLLLTSRKVNILIHDGII